MKARHFRFSPNVLVRLGEEMVPNPEQGIVELVKNAYDADATTCSIKVDQDELQKKVISITDNGVGMALKDITDGWLVIGSSRKAEHREPTGLGRLPVGDKGLGRLAAIRQGSKVRLITRPQAERGVEYQLDIDWAKFDKANVVEDIKFPVKKRKTDHPPGTEITLSELRFGIGKRELDRLARELVLLSDPFVDRSGFRAELIAPGFQDLENLVRNAYFEDADYRVEAVLNGHGIAKVIVYDWKGKVIYHGEHEVLTKKAQPYRTPAAQLELWVFLLGRTDFSAKKASKEEIKRWLQVTGGVHLYHRGLRVRPYGDPGHDWLDMNLARARSPEERPSTNNSIGRVIVDDPDNMLLEKTDRFGFIENEAFLELRRFAKDALDWVAKSRLKTAEEKRKKRRETSPRSLANARAKVEKVISDKVPVKDRPEVKGVVESYERAVSQSIKALRDDLQLYRSLATAGTTTAVFGHEAERQIILIKKLAQGIEKRSRELLGSDYPETFDKSIQMLNQISDVLRAFAKLPLNFLKREKRRIELVDVHYVIGKLLEVFEPFLNDANIQPDFQRVNVKLSVEGSVSLLEAIVANFITNSINAFNEEGARNEGRRIVIRTEISGDCILLRFLDNGPGIQGIDLDDIWLPGRTTTSGGTGFGLTIVKDSVSDLGGEVRAVANGELGGAEFIVELPRAGV